MNKVVLITGGSRGIGAATALEFAKNNYNVIINYVSSDDEANQLKAHLEKNYHIQVLLCKNDLRSEEEILKMFETISNTFGKLDAIVSNAGIAIDTTLEDKTKEIFNEVINVNLVAPFLIAKHGRRLMDKGSIVFVSSTNGIDTEYIESIDYDASKAGVISLMRNFANHYAPNIRVNVIAPGWVRTDMNKDLGDDLESIECQKILLERFAEPEEIAKVIYFVSSDDASYMNRSVVRVDGGF